MSCILKDRLIKREKGRTYKISTKERSPVTPEICSDPAGRQLSPEPHPLLSHHFSVHVPWKPVPYCSELPTPTCQLSFHHLLPPNLSPIAHPDLLYCIKSYMLNVITNILSSGSNKRSMDAILDRKIASIVR